ncbi:methyltransferase domain-containing protein [candidate division KSB1 bacterium]|nr:methyltransferase domain-containing protein [candidate division KSB1 bacterium]RQW05729.1 MAG: methyltransferase domain-containing protein [candidate division KSB1 bacterium]
MKILNLGCGTKTSSLPEVINIDWSPLLQLKTNRLYRLFAPLALKGERLERFTSLSDNIMVHNLQKGLQFAADSVDAVYFSHMLEHLDRPVARKFLLECKRVLKSAGIVRVAVPDMEKLCRDYLAHLSLSEHDPDEAKKHDRYVAAIIEQSVRREAFGTTRQKPVRRFLENLVLGDARRRGETHQWMYDRINLAALLSDVGFKAPRVCVYNQGQIPQWCKYRLEVDELDREYKPDSLYMEANKP